MAQHSIWRVKFHVEANAGRVTSGPYTTFVGISGGSRKDGQTGSTRDSVATAVTNNLLNILKELGNTALTAGPGGTVIVDSFEPGPIPDCWE